jgi:hypothetical protein
MGTSLLILASMGLAVFDFIVVWGHRHRCRSHLIGR